MLPTKYTTCLIIMMGHQVAASDWSHLIAKETQVWVHELGIHWLFSYTPIRSNIIIEETTEVPVGRQYSGSVKFCLPGVIGLSMALCLQ